MVFILLIFFIVTTVFVEEEGLRASTPGINPGEGDLETVTFIVSSHGEVFADGREIGLAGVRATVRNKMQGDLLPVVVKVEPEAPSGIMVRVMDEVKIAKPDAAISVAHASG